jgi:hypothetical protein
MNDAHPGTTRRVCSELFSHSSTAEQAADLCLLLPHEPSGVVMHMSAEAPKKGHFIFW